MVKVTRVIALAASCLFLLAQGAFADIPLNGDEVKCVNALNKRGAGVAKAQNKENRGCVKDKGKGKLAGTVDDCLTADPKNKVGKKEQKTVDDFGKKCGDVPDVGPTSAGAVNSASQDESINLFYDVFANPADGSIIDCDTDKNNCKCQDAVIKNVGKIFDTKMKEYLKCKKEKGKAGISSAADLEDCVDGAGTAKAASIAADGKGKIGKKVTKLGDDIGKKCGGVPATNAFPGECAGLGGNALRDCLDARIECRVCLAINAMDNLSVDCDLFDDGLSNGSCPPTSCLGAGSLTLTQVAGGVLTVDGLPAFPFPAGGTIVEDVGAPDANCVHSVVVPFPGGFTAPVFCIPALGFSTSVAQTACGIGELDSDGGSDYTVTEIGDTSAGGAPCFLPTSCTAGANSNVRVDVGVGDASADVCGSGTANAIVSVPVFTTTWLSSTFTCPDVDGTYDPGTDTLVVSFPQTLDFTTDTTTTTWADLDGPDCAIAGAGPAGGFGTVAGSCIDVSGIDSPGVDVTTVASGPVGSAGAPLFDLTFLTVLPNEVTSGGPLGATCASPPIIALPTGTATRCIP